VLPIRYLPKTALNVSNKYERRSRNVSRPTGSDDADVMSGVRLAVPPVGAGKWKGPTADGTVPYLLAKWIK